MRARYYNPYISRFLNPDASGFGGGLNFYLFCGDNPVSEEDPFGLYGYATAYWANLSVNGSWWQKPFAYSLGVLSATVPDAVAVSVNGNLGFIGGGTFGVQSVAYVQQGTTASYSFVGATAGPKEASRDLFRLKLAQDLLFQSLGQANTILNQPRGQVSLAK